MRKVDLRMNEQIKFDIIKRAASKEISVLRASVKLNCTVRTVYNLINTYKTKGKLGFVHGNRDRKPITKISDYDTTQIIQLYSNKYAGANFKHFQELLAKININVSYFALYKILTKAGFISPKCNKITRRNKQKLLKHKLSNNDKLLPAEVDFINETNLQDPAISHPRKPRAKYFGELLQMDASDHVWFGDKRSFLHIAIDDATGRILGAYFDQQETLNGYYHVFHQILTNYGIPAKFLTDNRTVFEYNKLKNPSDEKDTFTQFGYACHQLGVELNTSSIPQVKGRVERLFGTLQSRLTIELKLAGICDIQKANEFLSNYINEFNLQFCIPTNYTKSVFDSQITCEKINYTLAVISKRKIDNGNSIKFHNQYYQPYDENGLVCFKPKTTCFVLKTFNNELIVSVDEKVYELKPLETNKKHSDEFDPVKDKKPAYKGHKPADCHPWTYQSFKAKRKRKSA